MRLAWRAKVIAVRNPGRGSQRAPILASSTARIFMRIVLP